MSDILVTTEGDVTIAVTPEGNVTVGVTYNPVAGEGGGTNIGVTRTASSVVVSSSTGTDGTIPAADGSNAGVFTAADFTKLAAISGTNTGDQFIFKNVAVAGQSTVTAETTNDTLTLVAGTNVTLTTDAGTDSVTINTSSSGDVVGPASSTDNAFARFDSTTGKLLQNSTATLDDVGLASLDAVQFDTTPTTAVDEAKAVWNATNSCLSVGLNSAVTSYVGTDLHLKVYNPSATSMTVMQVVRQSGSSGTRLSVQLALADSDVTSATSIGVICQTITSHGEGFIQMAGLLQGVNTMAFEEGDTLWLSATTPGLITSTRPTAPNHSVRIGYCIKKSAGAGIILVDILNGFEIGELHDVLITEPVADNSFLTYDSAASVWLNEAPSAAKSSIGLSNVTNDVQTKAAVVPNTTPSAGQVLVGNAGGTAYAPVSASGDATLASTGALTLATVNSNTGAFGSATAAPAITVNSKGLVTAASTNTITPAVGSITGLGTGVATALAINTGSAGALLVDGGAGGTPSSITLTNATGTASNLTAGQATAALGLKSATTTVSVSSATAPTSGQALIATSGTTATWQTLASGGGGASNIWIPAAQWIPKTTLGCGVDSVETTTNDQNFDQLLFDAGADEFADAIVIVPNNWDNSTITARFYWTASTSSGDVVWGIQARAFANDDALDTAAGTAQTVTDTLTATNDMCVTSATSAVTIGGTPAANTPVQFTVYRDANAGGDTLAADARLLGVEILYTLAS